MLLKVLSLSAGGFLIIAGVVGALSAPFTYGGPVYVIGALYAIVFGLVVTTVEVKDKSRHISAAYDWIDRYLKFLTLQRGKGCFYLGVGLLVVFMDPSGNDANGRPIVIKFGITNISALVLAVVGVLHAFRIIKETGSHLGPGQERAADGLDFNQPIGVPGPRSEWTGMVAGDDLQPVAEDQRAAL